MNDSPGLTDTRLQVPKGTDLVEWYFEQGWTDGLPVVPPTPEAVAVVVAALGGDPEFAECKIPPRHGSLTREVLAVNLVMAGCKPEYAPVVRAALLALTQRAFNLNGVQATTHMAAPLLVVNGPIAGAIGMNPSANAFGSGNRANATIGRAISTKPPSATPANTPSPSPRTRPRARGRPTMSTRGSRPKTRPSSSSRPNRRTALPTMSPTTPRASSTASARR